MAHVGVEVKECVTSNVLIKEKMEKQILSFLEKKKIEMYFLGRKGLFVYIF